MSNFKKLVEERMAETNEGWQAASEFVRTRVLEEESHALTSANGMKRGKSPVRSFQTGTFLGPRTIEPGQTIQLHVGITADEWPWTPTQLNFIEALKGQRLSITSMLIGRREQMLARSGMRLDDLIGRPAPTLGLDMITMGKPLRMDIRNDGDKSQLLVGYVAGIEHTVPMDDPLDAYNADIEHGTIHLERIVLPPHSTKSIGVETNEQNRVGNHPFAPDVDYTFTQFITEGIEDVFIDVRIDGESQTDGFVESMRLGYERRARNFNMGIPPAIEFKKPFKKDKTKIEVVVKNDSDHPHSVRATLHCARRLTESDMAARLRPFNPVIGAPPMPQPEVRKQEERFPWNIDGKTENVVIEPGETKVLEGQVQCLFRGNELVVDEASREGFEIVDLKVGREPCVIFDKPIPASRFHADNKLALKLHAMHPGIILRLFVKNVSSEPKKFGATLKGEALF